MEIVKDFSLHWVKICWILSLIITFGYSASEKTIYYHKNIVYYQNYFSKNFIHRYIRIVLPIIIVWEFIITFLYTVSIFYQQMVFICSALSCTLLLLFLVAQRIANDYDGARGVILYIIFSALPALFF